jgi:hypothetical protein
MAAGYLYRPRTDKEAEMLGRAVVSVVALSLLAAIPAGAATARSFDDDGKVVLRRDDDYAAVAALDDDDDADRNTGASSRSRTGATSGVDSNDATNSRHTRMTRDRDRSRGDLTRDWTKDGGDRTRDWSRHHTNDRSRNDTR